VTPLSVENRTAPVAPSRAASVNVFFGPLSPMPGGWVSAQMPYVPTSSEWLPHACSHATRQYGATGLLIRALGAVLSSGPGPPVVAFVKLVCAER